MNKFKRLFVTTLASFMLVGVAACGSKKKDDPKPSPSGEPTQPASSPAEPTSPATPTSEPVEPTSSPAAPTSEPVEPTSPAVSPSEYIAPNGLYLDESNVSLLIDETKQLTATVTPSNATAELVWTSSDPLVVTVDDGLVKAIGAGQAKVTVAIKDTEFSQECLFTVAAAWHDYVKDGVVQLNLDYSGHDFFTDGVEQVQLLTPIDGDTAHFTTLKDKKTLKARFYGIDTPESTGQVQPWGDKASNFTKEKLLNAKANGTIVVSSPTKEYGAPNPDSTGSRYVSLIWINETKKNAPLSELYLLNLWIVQEGLSLVKNISDIPEFEDSFSNAQAQAKAYSKNMWSGDDPDFVKGDYKEVSLLDIKREVALSIADQSHVNAFNNKKVTFTGVVSSYADGTLYVQEFYPYNEEVSLTDGEWAGINIFCGMQEISSKFTKPNTYIRVFGLAKDSETFGFQITDTQGHWAAYAPEETDCKVILKAELNTEEHSLYTFHYTVDELNAVANSNNLESLFCSVSVEGTFTCDYCYISDDRAITLGFKETNWGIYVPFAYYGDPENPKDRWDEKADFEGRKFSLTMGTYCWHRQTSGKVVYQILPTSKTDLVWVQDN